ncbi:MAG: phage major capsid protein [Lactobacillaceae bacterium]|jgi:HK97 family phage major capsid protein|nr:phage major capsid protein [Lactobacillaceae bacterium]
MNIDESKKKKLDALKEAIATAQKLIDDPNASSDDANAAMEAVKQIQADIKALEELQQAEPASGATPPASQSDEPSSEATSAGSDSEAPTSNADDTKGSEAPASDGTTSEEPADDTTDTDKKKKVGVRAMPIPVTDKTKNNVEEQRAALNEYFHSHGEKRDGVTSTDAGVLIPDSIIYNPDASIETVTDLAQLVSKTKVNTASGKYPILKRPTTKLPSVAELEKNPELAKPDFIKVNWDVETYRGQLPISQESLDDAQVDLTTLVAGHIQNIKVNTTNAAISTKLATFKAPTKSVTNATLVDSLKEVVNVELDPAYKKSFVVTASLYNKLDTIKDNEGRYLLQDQIGNASGKTLFSLPVTVVEDTAFGGKLESEQGFVGDLNRAILFADRAEVSVNWVENDIYGKILSAVLRFDVEVADPDSGKFFTIADTPSA